MANVKVSALTADTSPTSDDLIPTVTDPAGTPASRKVTLANAITKAHGLSDGLVKVASGTMAVATASTDYAPATSGTGVLKGNGTGGFSTATANTDYYAPKAKLDATTAPGSSNDNTQGYAVGSVWVDVTGDKSYIAVDVSTGAAVWNDLTASAGGGINNVVEDLTPQLGGDLDLNGKNITTGVTTISPTEMSYLDGVTSAIQGQIDGKQAADADLTTLSTAFTSASALGPASLALHEDTDNGTNKITITGQSALAGDQVITLPDATGTVALTSDLSSYQPLDSDLTTIAGLTATTDNFIQSKSSAWASRTPTQVTADLIAMVGDSGAGGTKGLVPAPGAGDAAANKYLKADGTWTAISSGGQTLVDIIVAPSGGDYTTLGAALTAATSGQTIFVRSGTYVESAITITTTNLTIIGESRETTIISLSTNAITLSGTGLQMFNIQFLSTTGVQTYSGTYKNFNSCTFSHAAGTGGLVFSGTNANITNCRMISTSTTGARVIYFNCPKGNIVGNSMVCSKSSSAGTQGAVEYGGDHINVSGNYHEFAAGIDVDKVAVGLSNTTSSVGATFTGNYVVVLSISCVLFLMSGSTSLGTTVSGNTFYGGSFKTITLGSPYTTFSGNTIYHSDNTNTYVGISVEKTNIIVTGNTIYGPGTTATAGITVAGTFDNAVITDNNIYRFANGIQIAASTCDNTVISNNQIVDSTTGISDSGTGTNAWNNSWNVGSLINVTKQHVYMKNTSGGAMSAGQLVVWKAVANGDEVTTTTTAGDDKVFGVMVDAPANNAFGRVQTLGKNTVLKVDGTTDIAIGDPITTFTTAGIGAKAAAGDMIIGYALEAYTANDSNGVIDVLLVSPRLI